MKTPKFRLKRNQGFTLIEILVVVTIIALLVAILIPVTSKVLAAARVKSAVAEINTLRTLVGDAASRLGGTLPLTEGIDNAALVTREQSLLTRLTGNGLLTFTVLTTLDNVFMSLDPPMMEANFKSAVGIPFLRDTVPAIKYRPSTNSFYAQNGNYMYNGNNFRQGARVECALVSRDFNVELTSNRLANRVRNLNPPGGIGDPLEFLPGSPGVDFTLDGVDFLPQGSRCALVIYEGVPIGEAYEISRQLNAPSLLVSQSFSTASQIRGRVVYRGSTTVTNVFVYLGNF